MISLMKLPILLHYLIIIVNLEIVDDGEYELLKMTAKTQLWSEMV